ncbi:hypothetical protein STEG23_000775, partial [Scotinomys teguina]
MLLLLYHNSQLQQTLLEKMKTTLIRFCVILGYKTEDSKIKRNQTDHEKSKKDYDATQIKVTKRLPECHLMLGRGSLHPFPPILLDESSVMTVTAIIILVYRETDFSFVLDVVRNMFTAYVFISYTNTSVIQLSKKDQ